MIPTIRTAGANSLFPSALQVSDSFQFFSSGYGFCAPTLLLMELPPLDRRQCYSSLAGASTLRSVSTWRLSFAGASSLILTPIPPASELYKQFAGMHAQRACQLEDIQQRKIPLASFNISRITRMDARQFRQFRQGHSVLVAELPDCLPKNDLLAFVFRDHPTILD